MSTTAHHARATGPAILLACLVAKTLFAAELPVAVSPGEARNDQRPRARVATSCPTFSWGGADDAAGYELAVYSVGPGGDQTLTLSRRFPAAIESWTPALDECLERGRGYAWAVRATRTGGISSWSPLAHFETTPRPSRLQVAATLATVRRQLHPELPGAPLREIERFASALERPASVNAAAPSARATPPPASLLEVNGSPAVTLDTLTAALCGATEIRYLDQGDGTVLDCATGTAWLKDASCLGIGTWDGNEPVDPGSVQALLLTFNGGAEFNCGDYTAGTYSDWRIPTLGDLCGDWNGSCQGFGCCTAASGLLEMAYANPAIANARDDGQWADKDAFVDVSTSTGVIYWSNSYFGAGFTYAADISNATVFADSVGNSRYLWPVRKTP